MFFLTCTFFLEIYFNDFIKYAKKIEIIIFTQNVLKSTRLTCIIKY